MNEVVNSGVMNIASLVVSVVVLLIGLILWFLSIVPVHGLTNRLNCLRRCWISKNVKMHCYVVCAKQTNLKADKKTVESQKSVEDEDIIRLVAER